MNWSFQMLINLTLNYFNIVHTACYYSGGLLLARGRFLDGGWRVCRLFAGAPSEALEVALFAEDEGEEIAYAYGNDHADAAVEEETGGGEVLREEDSRHSAAETAQGGAATDAREEDAH